MSIFPVEYFKAVVLNQWGIALHIIKKKKKKGKYSNIKTMLFESTEYIVKYYIIQRLLWIEAIKMVIKHKYDKKKLYILKSAENSAVTHL